MSNEEYDSRQQEEDNSTYVESQKQVGAHLSSGEARYFFKMYMGLLDYINKKYQIVDSEEFIPAEQINPEAQVKLNDKLFEDLSIIDEYVQKNPDHLYSTVLKQVQEVKNAIRAQGTIVKYERNMILFIDDQEHVYGIVGITNNLDQIIPKEALPYFCKMTLVPYKGKIVYDGSPKVMI